MEGLHGVDVSWLHHSQIIQSGVAREQHEKIDKNTAQGIQGKGAQKESKPSRAVAVSESDPKQSRSNSGQQIGRPGMFHRRSSEKVRPASAAISAAAGADGRSSRSPSLSRKTSWLANLGAKFSGGSAANPLDNETGNSAADEEGSATNGSSRNKVERLAGTSPPQKQSAPGFLHSAIRRISSGSSMPYTPSLVEKLAPGRGGVVPRKVMNLDPHRERCSIQELKDSRLRRVSFSVDVEIAGTSTYPTDEARPKKPSDEGEELKKLEQSEGSALKESNSIPPLDVSPAIDGQASLHSTTEAEEQPQSPSKEMSRKEEKKKKSEGERKRRREKEHTQAVEDGQLPVEVPSSPPGKTSSVPADASTIPHHDRRTTNPSRIYKRCCQLREIHSNSKIVEQIRTCSQNTIGVIDSLDLSNIIPSNADVNALADFLAIVPIRRLILEECGLGDEGIRVVLAALLATPAPSVPASPSTVPPSRVDPSADESSLGEQPVSKGISFIGSRHGAIEKLSFRGNKKVGRDGWGHLALFIYMSRSLKGIDISMIPFPGDEITNSTNNKANKSSHTLVWIFSRALGQRLAGNRLQELVMAECDLTATTLTELMKGVRECGIIRLGLANNYMNEDGLRSVARYLATGPCEGLDLGANDLRDTLPMLIETLTKEQPLVALSLADCNLTPSCLAPLLPRLVDLPNFRFIDLSHNRELFSTERNALPLLRRFLPQMQHLKRIHLRDVNLNCSLAMALSELLAELPVVAHINLLNNPELTALITTRTDETSQQEAAALFASLMSAAKVSTSIICIDIDIPGPEASDLVKALAKRVVAYCLRNMAQGPIKEYSAAAAQITDPHRGAVETPDVLLHLVGPDAPDEEPFVGSGEDMPASDLEYVTGGTAFAKALDMCLYNRDREGWKPSKDDLARGISKDALGQRADQTKALEMSKNLLLAARKIKARIQPAIRKEVAMEDDFAYRKSSDCL